jgi:hypothetical protein
MKQLTSSLFQISDDLGKDDDDSEVDAKELEDDNPFKKFERGTSISSLTVSF